MFKIKRPIFKDVTYNIIDYGAKSDICFNNQKPIQNAIDECSKNGGGMVLIPSGYYLTGPIELKSNVNLHVSESAYVQFTKSKEEYPLIFTEYEGLRRIRAISPIRAYEANNIAITGRGVMDGAGHLWRGIKKWKLTEREWQRCLKKSPFVKPSNEGGIWCPTETYYNGVMGKEPDYNNPNALEIASECWDMYRPVFVSLIKCDKVLIEDITLKNSPAWNVHPLYCTNFTMNKAVIKNKFSAQNGDGIDIESCQNCEIANSVFEVGDDGICIKSGKNKDDIYAPTKNVWIHDCKVFDAHGGFVVGSEIGRGASNILVENCIFDGTDIGVRFKAARDRGGFAENIKIKNIQMNNIIGEAIIFTMNYILVNIEDTKEKKIPIDKSKLPEFKDIILENINCNNANIGIKINGLKESHIHDITIRDSKILAENSMELSYCENIDLKNTIIITPTEELKFTKEIINIL